MDETFKKSIEKVRTFANDILQQCQSKGLTVQEVRLLTGEISRQAEASIEKQLASEIFLK